MKVKIEVLEADFPESIKAKIKVILLNRDVVVDFKGKYRKKDGIPSEDGQGITSDNASPGLLDILNSVEIYNYIFDKIMLYLFYANRG